MAKERTEREQKLQYCLKMLESLSDGDLNVAYFYIMLLSKRSMPPLNG